MNLESPTVKLQKSPQDVFNFLSDIKNFEQLMPENISKFKVLSDDKFIFALKGMPEITLQKKESTAPNKIVFGAGEGKLDFNLTGDIQEAGTSQSHFRFMFNGDFNPMMAMMVKGPISKFIETLTTKLSSAL